MRCVPGAFEAWNGSISRDGNSQASATSRHYLLKKEMFRLEGYGCGSLLRDVMTMAGCSVM